MDAFSAEPVHWSTLDEDELTIADSDSNEDLDPQVFLASGRDLEEDDQFAASASVVLRDRLVRPRFERWLRQYNGGASRPQSSASVRSEGPTADPATELLQELFNRLTVASCNVSQRSSERRLTLEFTLAGCDGRYEQCSQADPASLVYDAEGSTIELLPNVEAKLHLDGSLLIDCMHFAGKPPSSVAVARRLVADDQPSFTPLNRIGSQCDSCIVQEERLGMCIGSDNTSKIGGIQVLLQFLGTICADAEAACYAEHLPFRLTASQVSWNVAEEQIVEQAPSLPLVKQTKSEAKPLKQQAAVAGAPTKPPRGPVAPSAPRPAMVKAGRSTATTTK